jgi:hypothetical protein
VINFLVLSELVEFWCKNHTGYSDVKKRLHAVQGWEVSDPNHEFFLECEPLPDELHEEINVNFAGTYNPGFLIVNRNVS